jgi:hypothetical protein
MLRLFNLRANLVITFFLISSSYGNAVEKENVSKTNGRLEVTIQTKQVSYIPYEPILIKYELRNSTDQDIVSCFLLLGECFEINDASGRKYPSIVHRDVLMLTDTLGPDDSFVDSQYIQISYQVLHPGEYTCRMMIPNGLVYPQYFSSIESNVVDFTIVEPIGEERSAYLAYLAADSLGRDDSLPRDIRFRSEFSAYLDVAATYPNTIYAPISLYQALLMTFVPNDQSVLIPIGKKLIEHYANSPYGAWAFSHLIDAYKKTGRRGAARDYMNELIEKYSGNVIAERAHYWLQKLQKGY